MSQSFNITSEPAPVAPPPRRGHPLLAWMVIFAAVGFILWGHRSSDVQERKRFDLLVMGLEGRYIVGLHELVKLVPEAGDKDLYEEAKKTMNRGTYAQRLRFVVMAGELVDAAEAREQLHRLNELWQAHGQEIPADDAAMAELLDHLYAGREEDPAAESLSPEERDDLRHHLGWFADLALNPANGPDTAARGAVLFEAKRTMLAMLCGIFLLLGLGAIGLALLIGLLVQWWHGRLQRGVICGSPFGAVYAETFALYLVVFLSLSYGASWLPLAHGRIALSGLAAVCSLSVLAWPVLRGVPWRQVRQDIGWHPGRRPFLEPLLGLGCYATALPMLLFGLLVVFALRLLHDRLGWGPDEFSPSDTPSHPIVFWVARSGWWIWLEILFVASVAAPIVEETMFRGVLYRHLREASASMRPVVSVTCSALLTSFLFAVIHPQGFLAVPALMALALAFTLAREWRGTLIPSMVAHGINNGLATLLLSLLVR
jgi:membrane protease YdiL (CAAX protease family)